VGMFDKVLGSLGLIEKPEESNVVVKRATSRDDKQGSSRSRAGESSAAREESAKASKVDSSAAEGEAGMRIIVVDPSAFDDVQLVADYLKQDRPVVINFENADQETAARIIDFVSGVTYALGGSIQKVGNHIFFAAPSNIDVGESLPEALMNGQFVQWQKNAEEQNGR